MSFMAMFPGLVYNALEDETRKKIEESSDVRRKTFELITVGAKVSDMGVYQKIAVWLLTVPEKKLKKLTEKDVEKGVGGYIDDGPLV